MNTEDRRAAAVKAKPIVLALERQLKSYKKLYLQRHGLPMTEDEKRGSIYMQSKLACLRNQQRYVMLAYAWLRGKSYAVTENKCRHLPKEEKLALAVSILTHSMVDHSFGLRLWFQPDWLKKEQPKKIFNKLPPEKIAMKLGASSFRRVR